MATAVLHHPQLKASFNGVQTDSDGIRVNKFKGIKYAHIPARFEKSKPIPDAELNGKTVDATRYGPKCPQVDIDVRHLLRIPEDYTIDEEIEDEFECLNLDVTVPSNTEPGRNLPVFIWIHGGSQAITFCSAASGICDTTKIIADSVSSGQPIIAVSPNYRLNIFGFGDGKGTGEINLSLKDQALAIDWVRRHIYGFGGNPENITLCGESAGAAYAHAHLINGPFLKRAILMSGSLYLSPPMPRSTGEEMLKACETRAWELEEKSLRECSQKTFKTILTDNNVSRCWMREESSLADWESKQEQVEELIIGDTEFESAIWKRGIEALSSSEIISMFTNTADIELGIKLCKAYHISPARATPSSLGALDFVHDTKHSIPIELLCEKFTVPGKKVYRYLLDEANPWQPSARAHHAVDLIFLFGTMDISHNPTAELVSREMRKRWIGFINGERPWDEVSKETIRFAFGPYGECKELNDKEFAARRRVNTFKLLREVGIEMCMGVANKLTAGRMSLLN